MIQGIDHIVVVVKDLDQAAKDYEQLGFTVIPGGQHPVGSHNVLISFRDGSYLEIIAFYREALDHRWWEPLSHGERLVDFCFQTDDLRGDTKKLQAAGVAINDPIPWSRKRPDGYELKWLLSLATGMFVSSISRDPQKAMGATLFLLVLLSALGPIIDAVLARTNIRKGD